jgi:hypothetical protein
MRKESAVESRNGIPLLGEMFPEIQAQTAFGVKQILVVALTLYIVRYEGFTCYAA